MKISKISLCIFLFLTTCNLAGFAQGNDVSKFDFFEIREHRFESFGIISNVEGEFFINKDWSNGVVYFNDNHVVNNVSLRYFIKGKEMHVNHDGKVMKITNPTAMDSIVFDKHKFVFSNLLFGTDVIQDYLDLLAGSSTKLFKHYTNKYIKARDVSGYQEQESNKYIIKNEYYVSINGNVAELFKPKKKTVLNLFADKQKNIISFVKKNKLKYTKEGDLIKIFDYYNSL